jgi:ABC-type nitrate/sulfonate/bicarbonate transport system substrate-binding protein
MSHAQPQQLRIGGVPEHFNLPWRLAIEAEPLAGLGVRVDWTDYAAGTGAMLAELAANRLDAAILLTEGAALGIGRGQPIEAVSLYTTTPLIWGVHVPPAQSVESVADLRGRRIAISRPGSGSHLMSLALAIEQSWPVAELKFEIVDDLAGAIRAFQQGRAEVFLWEHFTTAPHVDVGDFRRVGDFLSPWPAWTVCIAAAMDHEARQSFARLFTAVAEQAGALVSNPDRAALIGARYGLNEAAVEEWLRRTEWVSGPVSPTRALADATAMLRAAGALAG